MAQPRGSVDNKYSQILAAASSIVTRRTINKLLVRDYANDHSRTAPRTQEDRSIDARPTDIMYSVIELQRVPVIRVIYINARQSRRARHNAGPLRINNSRSVSMAHDRLCKTR